MVEVNWHNINRAMWLIGQDVAMSFRIDENLKLVNDSVQTKTERGVKEYADMTLASMRNHGLEEEAISVVYEMKKGTSRMLMDGNDTVVSDFNTKITVDTNHPSFEKVMEAVFKKEIQDIVKNAQARINKLPEGYRADAMEALAQPVGESTALAPSETAASTPGDEQAKASERAS